MSLIEGAAPEVLGVLLIGAEGCSETAGETWLREATDDEKCLFIEHFRKMIAQAKGKQQAECFKLSDITVDSSGRPYWLMAILDHPATPEIAREKAAKYTRAVRVHSD